MWMNVTLWLTLLKWNDEMTKMKHEQKVLLLQDVMKRLSELDALVQKTIPHECLSIHTEIDSIIDDVSELIDYI